MRSSRTSPFLVVTALAAFIACGDSDSATGPTSGEFASARESDSRSEASGSSSAAELRLRCELRTRGRSKISVDGKDLTLGTYSATVSSGTNSAASPAKATVGDEVEFDFDSDPDDIAAGATAISATFIDTSSTPHVTASIVDAGGRTIVTAAGNCRVRR